MKEAEFPQKWLWAKEAGTPFISFFYEQVLLPMFSIAGVSFGAHGMQNHLWWLGCRNVGGQAKQLREEIQLYLSEKWRGISSTAAGY